MGIPVWKPKKQPQQENSLRSTFHHQHSIAQHHSPQYRLHRRRQPTLLAEPFYIAADGYTTPASIPSSSVQQRSRLAPVSRTITPRQRIEIESLIQQRFNEKQELLDQLKITISLLDQFLSIREISGQHLALPPFITDDLLAILTATSTSLTSTNNTDSNNIMANLPTMNDTNYSHTLHRPPATSSPSHSTPTMPLRSYDRPANDTSVTRLVDVMIGLPPHASRWADLESNIASTHRRVCEQLNLLGSSLTASLPSSASHLTSISPMPSSPPRQSL
ncbi:hypothetical protein BCR42DRAFT_388441 [Absidia repens]|uniref:Uncharacterized protein n=1 Tax=Absidia repens TaxID=90262 RepID=A0A1X2ITW1_9FUNG|nr:hypothetical protein BCR42DRAFT_388441 [Absidia repens]